jgi:hypothetical protein
MSSEKKSQLTLTLSRPRVEVLDLFQPIMGHPAVLCPPQASASGAANPAAVAGAAAAAVSPELSEWS